MATEHEPSGGHPAREWPTACDSAQLECLGQDGQQRKMTAAVRTQLSGVFLFDTLFFNSFNYFCLSLFLQ